MTDPANPTPTAHRHCPECPSHPHVHYYYSKQNYPIGAQFMAELDLYNARHPNDGIVVFFPEGPPAVYVACDLCDGRDPLCSNDKRGQTSV
jgi:hypothetical protein